MKALYQQIKRRREADGLSTNAGFTLIELLIVIVVLGILAGVVIFALGGVTGKSAISACKADGATVSTAMAAYLAQNPTGPLDFSGTQLVGANNGLQSWPANYSHYTFGIATTTSPGSLTFTTTGGTTISEPQNTLMVNTNTSSAGAAPTDAGWAVYTPSACDAVK